MQKYFVIWVGIMLIKAALAAPSGAETLYIVTKDFHDGYAWPLQSPEVLYRMYK